MNNASWLLNLIGAFVCMCMCLSVCACSYTFNISSNHKTTLHSKFHLITKSITTNISG